MKSHSRLLLLLGWIAAGVRARSRSLQSSTVTANASKDLQKQSSADGRLGMKGGGSFSLKSNADGMVVTGTGKNGMSFTGSESNSLNSLETKSADIAGKDSSVTSSGEKAKQQSSQRAISFEGGGATTAAYATTAEKQGLSLNAADGTKMESSSTQSKSDRDNESTKKLEGGKEVNVNKSTEGKSEAQAENKLATTGKGSVAMINNGQSNKLKVDSQGSTTGSSSFAAKQNEQGSIEGYNTDGKTKTNMNSTYDKSKQVGGQLEFTAKEKNNILLELDLEKGLTADGQSTGEVDVKQNVDLKSRDSTKDLDSAKKP